MKANDWPDTIAMAASAIEDLLETADEHAGCWADVPARLRALIAPPAPAVPDELVEEPDTWKTPDVVFGWNACRDAMLANRLSQGYKLVPVEPTQENIAPFIKHCCENESWVRQAWREMLEAAPEDSNDA